MKKPLLIGLFVSLLSPVAWATPADWSGLFKSWEKGCDSSPALSAFTNSIRVNTDAKGQFYLEQSIKLPAQYRNQAALKVGFHKMYDEREKYTFDQIRLPLKGQYYGLPVVHYSQTFIVEETAGVEYQRLLLDVPIEQARRVLANKYRPRKHFNIVLEGDEILRAELLSVNINGKSQTVVECRYING